MKQNNNGGDVIMYNIVPSRLWGGRDLVDRVGGSTESIWDNLRRNFDDMFMDTAYYNSDGHTVYEVEVPGFNKDNLSVHIENGMVTIKGDRELEEGKPHVGNKKIYKTIQIEGMGDDVEAEIKDGILYITLKKIQSEIKKLELK